MVAKVLYNLSVASLLIIVYCTRLLVIGFSPPSLGLPAPSGGTGVNMFAVLTEASTSSSVGSRPKDSLLSDLTESGGARAWS